MDQPLHALCQHLTGIILSFGEQRALIDQYANRLTQAEADQLIDCLKARADTLRLEGKTEAARLVGTLMIAFGEQRHWFTYQGLGQMVRGDAFNLDHQIDLAWEALEEAGRLHHCAQEAGEPYADYQWARTLIGKWECVFHRAERLPQIKAESEQAETIFKASSHRDAPEKLLKLYNSKGLFFFQETKYDEARTTFLNILNQIRKLEHEGRSVPDLKAIALLLIGHIDLNQGRAKAASAKYRRTYIIATECGFSEIATTARQGVAETMIVRGLYRDALKLLEPMIATPQTSPGARVYAQRCYINCLLMLGLFRDAENEATKLLASDDSSIHDTRWRVYDFLAIAQAEQGKLEWARQSVQAASTLINDLTTSSTHAMLTRLRSAQIMLRQQNVEQVESEVKEVVQHLESVGHLSVTEARLILAESACISKEWDKVRSQAEVILETGTQKASSLHSYNGYRLLGYAERGQGNLNKAEIAFRQAITVIDHMQRDLTIAFRPSFLSNKGDTLCALIDLYLEQGRVEEAFEMLEHAKGQTFMGYLARNNAHHWGDDDVSQASKAKLDSLRQDLLARLDVEQGALPSEETKSLQQRIRAVVRDLYTHAKGGDGIQSVYAFNTIQKNLPDKAALIAFYDNGLVVRAFLLLNDAPIKVFECAPSAKIHTLHTNFARATAFGLSMSKMATTSADVYDAETVLRHPALNNPTLNQSFERAARQLYDALLPRALIEAVEAREILCFLPHRGSHLIPFHLLHDGQDYLIGRKQIVVLPTASAIVKDDTVYPAGSLIIHDDRGRRLRWSAHDAESIQRIVQGRCIPASAEDVLKDIHGEGGRLLHIIAHAQFEPEFPDTAFIQLGNKQFYLSDLLQHEIRYRLVTLTACETGRVALPEQVQRLAHGDDLIGIGRAFLYAGAQAVLASQWVLMDGLTLPMLRRFYRAWRENSSISGALQRSLKSLREEFPTLHPAFWGALQLIGSVEALT